MMLCNSCNAVLNPDASFCGECGAAVPALPVAEPEANESANENAYQQLPQTGEAPLQQPVQSFPLPATTAQPVVNPNKGPNNKLLLIMGMCAVGFAVILFALAFILGLNSKKIEPEPEVIKPPVAEVIKPKEPDYAAIAAMQEKWNGKWYGYMHVTGTRGTYADIEDDVYDAAMVVEIDNNGVGSLSVCLKNEEDISIDAKIKAESRVEVTDGTFWDAELETRLWKFELVPEAEGTLILIGANHTALEDDGGFYYELYLRPYGEVWEEEMREGKRLPPGYNDYLTALGLEDRIPVVQEDDSAGIIGRYIVAFWTIEGQDVLAVLAEQGAYGEDLILDLFDDGTFIWDVAALGADQTTLEGTHSIEEDILILYYDDATTDEFVIEGNRLCLYLDEETLILEKASSVAAQQGSAGTVSASVPNGWESILIESALSDNDPYGMVVYLDTGDSLDMFFAPGLHISVFREGEMFGKNMSKDEFLNSSDLAPLTLGNYTWNGYTGEYKSIPVTVLWTQTGKDIIEIKIELKNVNGEISLNDADVRAIISSVLLKP